MPKKTGKARGGARPGAGRPAGVSNEKTEERRRATAAAIEDTTGKGEKAEYLIALEIWAIARNHDEEASVRLDALKHLDNRLQGRPRESLEVTGAGGGPLETRVFRSRLSSGEAALAPPPKARSAESGASA